MTHMSRHTLIRLQILPLQSKHSHRWKSHQSEKLKGESSHFSLWCMLYRVIDDVPLDSSIIAPIPDKARFFTYSKWDGQQWQGTGNWLFFGEKKNLWRRQDIISWLSVKMFKSRNWIFFCCKSTLLQRQFIVRKSYGWKETRRYLWKTSGKAKPPFLLGDTLLLLFFSLSRVPTVSRHS